MAKTTLNIKIEEDTKEEAQILAKEMGLSLSAVVNGLIAQFVRTKSLNLNLGTIEAVKKNNPQKDLSSKKPEPEWFV